MRKQGTIRRFDDTRGFGFIDCSDSSNVFFHIRDFPQRQTPTVGMRVTYEEIQVGGKGPRGMSVQPFGADAVPISRSAASKRPASNPAPRTTRSNGRSSNHHSEPQRSDRHRRSSSRPSRSSATGSGLAYLLMLVWTGSIAYGIWSRDLPLWFAGAMLALNLITFIVYALDKTAAQNGARRTSEAKLHLLALLGGWPAAWFAQQLLRHKSSKHEFRVTYWGTVILNVAAVAALLLMPQWRYKLQLFRSLL